MSEQFFSVEVDGKHVHQLNSENLKALDLVKTPDGNLHVIHKSRSLEVKILEANLNEKIYILDIDGVEHTIKIKDRLDQLIDRMGLSKTSIKQVQTIHAPMPGLILDLLVEDGQKVEENDPLLILEAMKMENVIKSPRSGIINSVQVNKGDAIDKDALLIEFE